MGLVGAVLGSPELLSHHSMTFRKPFLPLHPTFTFGKDGMVTFSAYGGRNELLCVSTLKLLKCKEGEGEGTAGFLAASVITQKEQSRWLVDGMQGPDDLNMEEGTGCTWNPDSFVVVERN